jgi:hypothetical protein
MTQDYWGKRVISYSKNFLPSLGMHFYQYSGFIKKIFGERALSCLGGAKSYLMESNHPIVQIFYLIIAVGGYLYLLKLLDSSLMNGLAFLSLCLISMWVMHA